MKPRLYDKDNPIKWRELSFDELLRMIEGRVNHHLSRQYNGDTTFGLPPEGKTRIYGLLVEDLKQELVFSLWKKLDRIPADIIVFDFRFLKYIDTIFARTCIDLVRSRTFIDKESGERAVKDELNRAIQYVEGNDDLL